MIFFNVKFNWIYFGKFEELCFSFSSVALNEMNESCLVFEPLVKQNKMFEIVFTHY